MPKKRESKGRRDSGYVLAPGPEGGRDEGAVVRRTCHDLYVREKTQDGRYRLL